MTKQNDQAFFVGYLAMPATLKRFYIPLIAVMIGLSALIGYALANTQMTTGPARWLNDNPQTMQGLIKLEPYPVLHRFNPDAPNKIESVLLVAQGKWSADKLAAGLDGQLVNATGFPIYRGGWSMLELRSKADLQVIAAADEAATAQEWAQIRDKLLSATGVISLGAVSFAGEIADSKCFLGVMKPGEGVVHRACAEVCLIGGLPAMLLVKGQDQQRYGYMLTTQDGGSAAALVSSNAGDLMQVSGELMQKGNLLYLKMAASSRVVNPPHG